MPRLNSWLMPTKRTWLCLPSFKNCWLSAHDFSNLHCFNFGLPPNLPFSRAALALALLLTLPRSEAVQTGQINFAPHLEQWVMGASWHFICTALACAIGLRYFNLRLRCEHNVSHAV